MEDTSRRGPMAVAALFCVCVAALFLLPPCAPAPASTRSPSAALLHAAAPPPPSPALSSCGGGCGGRGTCMVGGCVCHVGATGARCGGGAPRNCSALGPEALARCFWDDRVGTVRVDAATWRAAQAKESGWWRGSTAGMAGDRAEEQTRGFARYAALPPLVGGDHAEFGCGPFTQTLTSLLPARPDVAFRSVTLLDPNLLDYVRDVPSCTFAGGGLPLPGGAPTYLVAAGAEAPLFFAAFDSLIMVNVLEHVQDAAAILHNVWAALRPGGVLIFHDRVFAGPYSLTPDAFERELMAIHPVRIREPLIDDFLRHVDVLYEDRVGTKECLLRRDNCIYIIARKRSEGEPVRN